MKDFLLSFLSTALTMSAVIGIMLIFSRAFKNKFTATCRYIIWAVIIVRLVLPVGLFGAHSIIKVNLPYTPTAENVEVGEEEFPLEFPETEYIGNNTVQPAVTAPVSDSKPPVQGGNMQGNISVPENNRPVTPIPDTPKQPSESTGNVTVTPVEPEKKTIDTDTLVRIVFTVWLTGAVTFFTINMGKYILFAIKLRKTSRRVTDMDLALRYVDVCNGMKVYNAPYLYTSDNVSSPLLYGYFRCCAVLPADISNEGLEYIFTHEIIHFKRGDIWLKLVALISNSLYWFNPLVYLAVRELNDEMELSCDEKALKGLGEEERIAYSRVLLETAGKCKKRKIGLTTAFDSKESKIKSRINSILDATKKRKGTVIIIAVLVVCIAAGLIIGFGFKNGEEIVDPEPKPSEETTDLTAEGWKKCEVNEELAYDDLLENFDEYGFDYRSTVDSRPPAFLAKEDSDEMVFYTRNQAYVIRLNTPFKRIKDLDIQSYDLNRDGTKEWVITYEYGLYIVKIEKDNVYFKEAGFTEKILKIINERYSYTYSAETKHLTSKYFDRKTVDTDLYDVVETVGADFSYFEYDDKVKYQLGQVGLSGYVNLTPVFANGSKSTKEMSFKLHLNMSFDEDKVAVGSITPMPTINVTVDRIRNEYSNNPDYVTLFSNGTAVSRDFALYGERTGADLVISLSGEVYKLPVKWKNEQPVKVFVNDSKSQEGKIFIVFYNSIEDFRIHYVQIDRSIKYVTVLKTIDYDDLQTLLKKRFSYSYDKEKSKITYLRDGAVGDSYYFGKIVEKYGKDFDSFEYRLGDWEAGSYGHILGKFFLYPQLEDGSLVQNEYKTTLIVDLYYDSITTKISLNPVTFTTDISNGMSPSSVTELVSVADNIKYPFDCTKYLTEQERYVKLRTYDDGTGLFGKYGGKQMLYYVDENDYYHINMKWIINESMLGFSSYKTDLDGNGRSELVLYVGDKVYVVDKVNGSYTMFSYEKEDALDNFNKSFSYKYVGNTKTVILYNNGTETSRLNFGNKLLSPDDFLGFNKPGTGGYSLNVKDNNLSVYISFTGIFAEGKGYYKELARVTSHVVIKYSPERGLYFGGLEDLYLETNGREGGLHNATLYSNSDYWTLRSDEEFFLHIDGKNGEHFSYPNLIHLHYSTWVGPVYEPNGDEEPIVWGLYSDYAPGLYVFDDGMRGIITYLCANVEQGYGRIERAVIVDLVDGRILHDGGMTERMMFDAHGISDEIRKKYHFISQAMPMQYDITFSLKEVSPGIIRFENSLISFDGNMILKGYTDYNVDTWEVSDYVITENTVR